MEQIKSILTDLDDKNITKHQAFSLIETLFKNHKMYEVIECECGHTCPVEIAHVDMDGNYTCPVCVIEELSIRCSKLKKKLYDNNRSKSQG